MKDARAGARGDLKPLTSLRFVAALMVFAYHVSPLKPWAYVFATGDAGVSFFFVLSGFILAYTYPDLAAKPTRHRLRAFYVARLARVYPMHVVAAIIAWVVLAVFGSSDPLLTVQWAQGPAIAAQLALLQSWIPAGTIHFGMNGPSWSLSDEAFFYALFPFIFPLVVSLPRDRHLAMLGVTLWSAVIAIAWLIPGAIDDWVHYVVPIARLPDFMIGVLAGVLFTRRRDQCGTASELATIEFAVASLWIQAMVPVTFHAAAVMLPAWVMLIYVTAHQSGLISRLLSHPAAVQLGRISFAFYLVHLSVIRVVEKFAWVHACKAFGVLIPLVLSLLLALVLNRYVEEPARRLIRDLIALPFPRQRLPMLRGSLDEGSFQKNRPWTRADGSEMTSI